MGSCFSEPSQDTQPARRQRSRPKHKHKTPRSTQSHNPQPMFDNFGYEHEAYHLQEYPAPPSDDNVYELPPRQQEGEQYQTPRAEAFASAADTRTSHKGKEKSVSRPPVSSHHQRPHRSSSRARSGSHTGRVQGSSSGTRQSSTSSHTPATPGKEGKTQALTKYVEAVSNTITFRVNLEFFVALSGGETEHSLTLPEEITNAVYNNGIEIYAGAPGHGDLNDTTYDHHWRVSRDEYSNSLPQEAIVPYYEYREGCEEIASPVVNQQGLENFHTQLDRVCSALHDNFEILQPPGYCGTHVLVGQSGTEGFDFTVLRRVASIWAVAEGTIMGMHNPRRQDIPGCYLSQIDFTQYQLYPGIANISTGERNNLVRFRHLGYHLNTAPEGEDDTGAAMYQGNEHETGTRLLSLAETFWRFVSKEELSRALMPPHHLCIGRLSPENPGQTIEFRCMEGSLSPDLIGSWAEFCCAVVTACVELPTKAFRHLLLDLIVGAAREDLSVYHLMRMFGCKEGARKFSNRRFMRSEDDFRPVEDQRARVAREREFAENPVMSGASGVDG